MAFFASGYFTNFVYEKSDWDNKTFAVDAGLKASDEKTAAALDAVDPDLQPFQARGGKLILYPGWNDPAIPAVNTVSYYESVVAKMGQKDVDAFVRLYDAFVRLYMVSGMWHWGGGQGADAFGQVGHLNFDGSARSVDAAL